MSTFWPEGLSVSDTQSPCEILESAREEWETASYGTLTLVFQKAETQNGNTEIIVHAKHIPSNRTETLLSAIHRSKKLYPITIQTKRDEELPTILKKSYYQPGIIDSVTAVSFRSLDYDGKTVTNEWVSDTPSEFREKLSKAFNLSVVKAAILNLTNG